jgi:dTDP-4-amino-4,6-dideoxygalactose transaminase
MQHSIPTHPSIPFVDLTAQHQPIQAKLEQAVLNAMRQGDYVLGQELSEFETAFAQACGSAYGWA